MQIVVQINNMQLLYMNYFHNVLQPGVGRDWREFDVGIIRQSCRDSKH